MNAIPTEHVDATLVRPGDHVPGYGRVVGVIELPRGRQTQRIMLMEDGSAICAMTEGRPRA